MRNLFPSNDLDARVSPFLLLDYAGPTEVPPSPKPRGVGEHPHRGFETVTVVYQGRVAHRDSAGHHGVIGPGDVQWMTAAAGVVHEEMHEADFARTGGVIEMIQLWVNLPAAKKMSAPHYQTLTGSSIPTTDLPGGSGTLRVIAGDFAGRSGPARTVTPIQLFDVHLRAGQRALVPWPEGHTAAVFLRQGSLVFEGAHELGATELAVFATEGGALELQAGEDAAFLMLGGEPIREPIARYGPFVMNTEEELMQAFEDYQEGRMGRLRQ